MFEIALYNALTKLGLEPDEAEKAVADVASNKNVATKADITELKAETRADIKDMATKKDLAELETRLTKLIYAVAAVNIIVVIAAVGLMIRFL